MPSAKIDSCSIAPPEKMFIRPKTVPEASSKNCWMTDVLMPGVATAQPIR